MILLDIDYGVLFDESLKIGVPVLLAVFGGLGTLLTFLGFKSSTTKKEDASKSFNNIVDELASAEIKTNIAAAIKIRRFFAADVKKHSAHLCKEAINVISSLLRVLSTGVLQKTLADGLAYAENLSLVDLQRTNLQNAYIGYKKETRIKQQKAGCDYIIYMPNNEELYVDLKVCIGPNYNMVEDDYNDKNDYTEAIKDGVPKGVPIEVYQNNNFTFSKGKLTDYVLFIIMDSDGITYSLLDYDKVHKIALEHKKQWDTRGGSATLVNKGRMKWHRSNNGSGIYIKYTPTK